MSSYSIYLHQTRIILVTLSVLWLLSLPWVMYNSVLPASSFVSSTWQIEWHWPNSRISICCGNEFFFFQFSFGPGQLSSAFCFSFQLAWLQDLTTELHGRQKGLKTSQATGGTKTSLTSPSQILLCHFVPRDSSRKILQTIMSSASGGIQTVLPHSRLIWKCSWFLASVPLEKSRC